MVIVAGHLIVDASERDAYLAGCVAVVEAARAAVGCLDFAIGADLADPARINVFERWESPAAVEAFRAGGPDDAQSAAIRSADVREFDAGDGRALFDPED